MKTMLDEAIRLIDLAQLHEAALETDHNPDCGGCVHYQKWDDEPVGECQNLSDPEGCDTVIRVIERLSDKDHLAEILELGLQEKINGN